MTDKNIEQPSKRKVLRILVPILIVIVLVGIWFIKNNNKDTEIVESINEDFSLHVTDELDIEKLKSYGIPIIIDFGADSCDPCKEMAPVLIKLNKELQGKAIVKFIDVWKYSELGKGYPIRVIPTQIFIDKDGKPYTPSDSQGIQMLMYATENTNEHVFTVHEGGTTEEELLMVLEEMGLE